MAKKNTIATDTWIDGDGTLHVNDIFLSGGQIAMSSGSEAYASIIESAVRTRAGELPLDTGQGIPYFETVFQSPDMIPDFEAAIRSRIEELYFVDGVTSLVTEFDRGSGILRYTVTVETVGDGEVTVEGGLGRRAFAIDLMPTGGGSMNDLVQDGQFYLPVHKTDGVQYYRILTDAQEPGDCVQPAISEELFKKNPATGKFEEVSQ